MQNKMTQKAAHPELVEGYRAAHGFDRLTMSAYIALLCRKSFMSLMGLMLCAQCSATNRIRDAVEPLMQQAIAQRVFPGGVVLVAHQGRVVYHEPFGRYTYQADASPVTRDTLFDIASITKFIATMPAIMSLVVAGKVQLDDPIVRYIPELRTQPAGDARLSRILVRHLLTHTGGFADKVDIGRSTAPDQVHAAICTLTCLHQPGVVCKYACRPMHLLKIIIERASGQSFDTFVRTHWWDPIGLRDTYFVPKDVSRCVPIRTDLPAGQVYDDTAHALGGIAGNAGIFSTARDLNTFAQYLLKHIAPTAHPERPKCNEGLVEGRAVKNIIYPPVLTQWFTPRDGTIRGYGCELGRHLGLTSFGHFGWAGTSLWIDPDKHLVVVLLTNRTYGDGDRVAMRALRENLHDAIWSALGYPPVVGRLPPPPL